MEDHHSLNYADQYFVTVYQDGKYLSGIAPFMPTSGNMADSGCYRGFDSYWLVLDGKKYLPQNTDSISLEGISGILKAGFWRFIVERGTITAYAWERDGGLVMATLNGRDYFLEQDGDKKALPGGTLKIPKPSLPEKRKSGASAM